MPLAASPVLAVTQGGMETKEEVKLELETRIQQDTDTEPKMSTIQAKRRFMITDILNSAVESARDKQGPGLDMRLLFPGSVPRLPLAAAPAPGHHEDHDADSDNEADEDQEDGEDKGSVLYF